MIEQVVIYLVHDIQILSLPTCVAYVSVFCPL